MFRVPVPFNNYEKFPAKGFLLGHGCSLQTSILVSAPTHGSPPNLGVGLEQVLLSRKVPPPQLSEQDSIWSQGDHIPSAGKSIFSQNLVKMIVTTMVVNILGTRYGLNFRIQFGLTVVPSMIRWQVTFMRDKRHRRHVDAIMVKLSRLD